MCRLRVAGFPVINPMQRGRILLSHKDKVVKIGLKGCEGLTFSNCRGVEVRLLDIPSIDNELPPEALSDRIVEKKVFLSVATRLFKAFSMTRFLVQKLSFGRT